jgi:mannose-1-phosphate guanylyltransferase
MLKAVILIGGPQKGTRFRPLSLDVPKPLFPVAGLPTVQHHIEACCKVPNLKEILMIGFFQMNDALSSFLAVVQQEYKVNIRYLQEYTALGTAGGIYHFRDQIKSGNPSAFFLLHGDVCGDFPLVDMLQFHKEHNQALITVMATEATRQQSLNYGCMVENKAHEVLHYAEKPSTFVSALINCGVYLCSVDIFQHVAAVFKRKQEDYYNYLCENGASKDAVRLEQDIVRPLAGTGSLYVYHTSRWWSQMKTAGSAIYANRHYLDLYRTHHPDRLTGISETGPRILGDVFIHPSAVVDPSATLGPNVSIGKGVTIGPGVRIRESIVLGDAIIQDHACILYSIIGWSSVIGAWSRVEGTPCDPNPNKPFAKMENVPLFNNDGRLNPSITILGCNVLVPPEVIVLNSIVLPHKDLGQSYKNEIIL